MGKSSGLIYWSLLTIMVVGSRRSLPLQRSEWQRSTEQLGTTKSNWVRSCMDTNRTSSVWTYIVNGQVP